MSTQQVIQSRYLIGFGRGKGDRDISNKPDNKSQSEKPIPSRSTGAGMPGKNAGHSGAARDRLVFLTSCFIGQRVDIQVKHGSIYTGIFHSTSSEKDFGVILKMAQLEKDASHGPQKSVSGSASKLPIRTLIIPANELVQVIAKDVLVTSDVVSSDIRDVKQKDILIDSYISQSHPGEVERELGRWVPDESDPVCSNLENVFDVPWNRGWDQFQANEALFGVKSTFDEELYTTKLERGPQTRELEREALRIAREIEGEETHDLHLAEERGVLLDEQFDIDEETKYSSVFREIDDRRYEENNDLVADSVNDDTFGELTSTSAANDSVFHPGSSSLAEGHLSQPCSSTDPRNSTSSFDAETSSASMDNEARGQEDQFFDVQRSSKESLDRQALVIKGQTSQATDSQVDLDQKESSSGKESTNTNATSASCTKEQEKIGRTTDSTEVSLSNNSQNEPELTKTRGQPDLSPGSLVGSLSSEKSTLNPHAKEFKLNPNAKSFVPTQTNSRPLPPVSNGSYYYPNSVPHMPGMRVGVRIGPSFTGHQQVIYNPQGAPLQSPQGYYHSNGPQYGQHVVLGSTQPVMYIPGYPPEMPYKREY